uniref:Uncharacterized protein n=1 Tax=Gasterosteus aculeatus aculeatus TaxID=481459 RepID=A0AAQ4PH35_GASAC
MHYYYKTGRILVPDHTFLTTSKISATVKNRPIPMSKLPNQNLVLDPKYNGALTSIIWKTDGDWVYYRGFKKQNTMLNVTSGLLTLINLPEVEQGIFTVELNNIVHSVNFSVHLATKEYEKTLCMMLPSLCTKHTTGNVSGTKYKKPLPKSWKLNTPSEGYDWITMLQDPNSPKQPRRVKRDIATQSQKQTQTNTNLNNRCRYCALEATDITQNAFFNWTPLNIRIGRTIGKKKRKARNDEERY